MAKAEERNYMIVAFEDALKDIFEQPKKEGDLREIDKIINISNGKSKKYLKELKRFVDACGIDSIIYWGFIQHCQSVELLKDIYAFMVMNSKVNINTKTGAITEIKKSDLKS